MDDMGRATRKRRRGRATDLGEAGIHPYPGGGQDLDLFKPKMRDRLVVTAMLHGNETPEEISAWIGDSARGPTDPGAILKLLLDPYRMRWISGRLLAALPYEAGFVWLHILRRAMAGDVPAARLFLKRFDRELGARSGVMPEEPRPGSPDLDADEEARLIARLREVVASEGE